MATLGPALAVACIPVKRVSVQRNYSRHDYEICLLRERKGEPYSIPFTRAGLDQDPGQVVLQHLVQQTGLTSNNAYALKTYGKPTGMEHVVTILYAASVAVEEVPWNNTKLSSIKFQSIANVLEKQESGHHNYISSDQWEMIHALDHWLKERHIISFVNPDLLFLCSDEGEGVGGLVKAIIENPVYQSKAQPPEDKLIIELNNPLFYKKI